MVAREEKHPRVVATSTPSPLGMSKNKSVSLQSSINFIVYVVCIASLGTAVYSNVRLRTHDERIRSIESILRDSGYQWRPSEGVIVAALPTPDKYSEDVNYVNVNESPDEKNYLHRKPSSGPQELLERLQHQVAGIQSRLRRDVSQLPLIRPQANDCLCPPGEFNSQAGGGDEDQVAVWVMIESRVDEKEAAWAYPSVVC